MVLFPTNPMNQSSIQNSDSKIELPLEEISTSLEEYLKIYDNKKTRENYRLAIAAYLKCLYQEIPSKKVEDIGPYAFRYLQELNLGRSYQKDLRAAGIIFTKMYAPMTANLNLKCTCMWLEDSGYSINRRDRQRIFAAMPPSRPVTRELELKRPILREMYHELPDHVSPLLLCLAGSGMRLGEAMLLEKTDLDYSQTRVIVHLRAGITKTKTARITYLTIEAADALEEYLESRNDSDPRLFPYSPLTAQYHFRTAVDKLGYGRKDPRMNIRQMHWHMTRKWFISRFSLVASKEVAEYLAGHEGYLARSYQRYTTKQILKEFKKAEKKISILR